MGMKKTPIIWYAISIVIAIAIGLTFLTKMQPSPSVPPSPSTAPMNNNNNNEESCNRSYLGVLSGALMALVALYYDNWLGLSTNESIWKRRLKAMMHLLLPFRHLTRTWVASSIGLRAALRYDIPLFRGRRRTSIIINSAPIYLNLQSESAVAAVESLDDNLKLDLNAKPPVDVLCKVVGNWSAVEISQLRDSTYFLLPAFSIQCMTAKEALVKANVLPNMDELLTLEANSTFSLFFLFSQIVGYFISVLIRKTHRKLMTSPIEVMVATIYLKVVFRTIVSLLRIVRPCHKPLVLHLDQASADVFAQHYTALKNEGGVEPLLHQCHLFYTVIVSVACLYPIYETSRNWSTSRLASTSLILFQLSGAYSLWVPEDIVWGVKFPACFRAVSILFSMMCFLSYGIAAYATYHHWGLYRDATPELLANLFPPLD